MQITTGIKLTILLPLICLGVLPAAGEVKTYKADEIISAWVSVLPGASEWQADDDSILNDGRIGAVLLCADRECPDNYSFKVDIKNNINDARWFGIICNYQQNSDAYIFRIKVNKLEPEKGAFQLLRRSQNTLSIIATEALVLYSGETYTLELTRKDAAYFSLQIRQGADILAQKTDVMNDEFLGGRFGFFNDGAPQGTVAWIGAAFHSLNNTGRTFQNNKH